MTGEFDSGVGAVPEIEYWQGRLRLVAFGGRDVARSLPRDEVTAAVVLGAMLARNRDDGTWPGEYRAVVRNGGTAVVVREDDLRVAAARAALHDLFVMERGQPVRRDFSAAELEAARCVVMAVEAPGSGRDADAGLRRIGM